MIGNNRPVFKQTVKKVIVLLIFFTTFNTLSQNKDEAYFHRRFTKRVNPEKVNLKKYVRTYEKKDSLKTLVTDYYQYNVYKKSRNKLRGATYIGFKNNYEIDSFFNYYQFLGYDSISKFKGKYALVKRYNSKGELVSEKLYKNDAIRYIQSYHRKTREPMLINGNGVEIIENNKRNELTKTIFKDSLIVKSYTVRKSKNDTIFHKPDTRATPKKGMKDFYRTMVTKLKFPKKALQAGIERNVTVLFVVNELGELVDFEIESKKHAYFEFEEHTVEVLKKLPKWKPATINGKPVKTGFRLPVTFALTD